MIFGSRLADFAAPGVTVAEAPECYRLSVEFQTVKPELYHSDCCSALRSSKSTAVVQVATAAAKVAIAVAQLAAAAAQAATTTVAAAGMSEQITSFGFVLSSLAFLAASVAIWKVFLNALDGQLPY